jgi:hypothetical protein
MMKTKKIIYFFAAFVLIMIIYIAKDTFTQPNVGDLDGKYVEQARYRNENNTGPIVRLYAVSTADTLWQEMEEYGNMMPHSKYGNTKVYFFAEGNEVPSEIGPEQPYFEEQYHPYCLAKYEKSAMGEVSFKKYPFGAD